MLLLLPMPTLRTHLAMLLVALYCLLVIAGGVLPTLPGVICCLGSVAVGRAIVAAGDKVPGKFVLA